MKVLIDFDNIPEIERQRGLPYLVSRITSALGATSFFSGNRLLLRLYGGWFKDFSLSKRAQNLIPQIAGSFPSVSTITNNQNSKKIIINMEIAQALLSEPSKSLTHTYRIRSAQNQLDCLKPPFINCKDPSNCPVNQTYIFLSQKKCPTKGCSVEPGEILVKPEQKLVDSMIVVDLMHLSFLKENSITVISSDDDIWPGIQYALNLGSKIIHIHPIRGRNTPSHYLRYATSDYFQSCF